MLAGNKQTLPSPSLMTITKKLSLPRAVS